MPPRLYCLDVVRGIAAFTVVLWHWQHFFFSRPGILPTDFQKSSQPLYKVLGPFYNHGGGSAVSFFFLLSGFVFFWLYGEKIQDGSCSIKSFWLARFSRLYPLHFVTLILVMVLQLVYQRIHHEYFVYPFNDLYHFGLNLIFGSHWGFQKGSSFNAPIWSVSIEIGLYAVFFLAMVNKRASWKYLVFYIAVLVFSQKFGIFLHGWNRPLENFFSGGLTFYMLYFYLGHKWRNRITDIVLILLPIASWILIAVSDSASAIVLNRYSLLIRFVFPATIVGLIMLELVVKAPFYRFKWIGDCTYSSYLLHFPLQMLFILVAPSVISNVEDAFYSTWMFLAYFLILIPLSLFTFHFFEVPAQNYIRRLGKRLFKVEPVVAGN